MARTQQSGSMSPAHARELAQEQDKWVKSQERVQHKARVAVLDEALATTKREGREQHAACVRQTHEVRADASREAAVGRKSIALTRHEAEARAREVWRSARVRLQADKEARIAEQEGTCAVQDAEAREEAARLLDAKKQERRSARALRLTERHAVERDRAAAPKRRESTAERIDALTSEVEHSAPELLPYLRAQPRAALAALVNDEASRASAFERFVEGAGEDEDGVASALADAYSDEDLAREQAEYMAASGVPF